MAVEEREKLTRTLEVMVLGYWETRWRNPCHGPMVGQENGTRFYADNENTLKHLLSRRACTYRGGGSYFMLTDGIERRRCQSRLPLQTWLEVKGLLLFMWDRDTFIVIKKEFGQSLDVNKKTLAKEKRAIATIRKKLGRGAENSDRDQGKSKQRPTEILALDFDSNENEVEEIKGGGGGGGGGDAGIRKLDKETREQAEEENQDKQIITQHL